ncbi:imelysin family protein [Marinobacter sp. 1Y8]
MARIATVLLLAILVAACSEPTPPSKTAPAQPSEKDETQVPEAIRAQVNASSEAACSMTSALTEAVTAFLASPDETTLSSARSAWKHAHLAYRSLDTLYQLADLTPPQIKSDRDSVDAHPMLPGYLDQVPGYPRSGLVYSEVPLTPDFMRKEHQSTDFFYLTLGFHPIESLLWPPTTPKPAKVVATFASSEKQTTDHINAPERRQTLLRVITLALKKDTAALCQAPNQAHLIQGLATLAKQPTKAITRLERQLADTVGRSLDAWAKNPEGEDRNGMPLAHSPQALTDFEELAAITSVMGRDWLPMLAPDSTEAATAISKQLESLTAQLEAIDLHQTPSAEGLAAAKQTLASISDDVTSLALSTE